MKTSSIRKTLPYLTRLMVLIFLLLILPANFLVQLHIHHQSQLESTSELFGQLEQLIQVNAEDIRNGKQEFSEKCIQSAEMAAYFVAYDPEVTEDLEQTRELARKLDVDEIHFINPEGEIYAGTHPQYYGYNFRSGEQMMFFLPMLEDRSLRLCQEITPNTAEGKEMQYAAVWREDGSGIVQIGMEPRRLLKEIDEKCLVNMISTLPFDLRGYLHIVDKDTLQVIASTSEKMIGTNVSPESDAKRADQTIHAFHQVFEGNQYCVYTKEFGNYILVRTYLSQYLVRETFLSTVLILIYILSAAAGVIWIVRWYIDRKLTTNLLLIINDLEKIKEGNVENIMLKTGVAEFDELIFYVNQMLLSVRTNWDKLSHIMDKGQIPIGVFEQNLFYRKIFINERMIDIFGIRDYERESLQQTAELLQDRIRQAEACVVDPEEHICEYDKNGTSVYLRIDKEIDEQSVTYYVTDVSSWWGEIYYLREQSEMDSLTGLCNRRGFSEKMAGLFAKKEELGCAAVIMADADNLKKINDLYGHHTGDKYLKDIAALLQESSGENAVCARLGGDEFVIFLYGYSSIRELEEIVSSIKMRRGEKLTNEQSEVQASLQFSVGTAFYPTDGEDYHLLMHIADDNMYQEKKMRKKESPGSRGL